MSEGNNIKTEWAVNFDEEADVLYLTAKKQAAIAHEISDGIFVRVAESGEMVGVTITDLRERLRECQSKNTIGLNKGGREAARKSGGDVPIVIDGMQFTLHKY